MINEKIFLEMFRLLECAAYPDFVLMSSMMIAAVSLISWIILTWISRYCDNLNIAISSINIARFFKKLSIKLTLWPEKISDVTFGTSQKS